MPGWRADYLKKAAACGVSAALLLTGPGLPISQAFANRIAVAAPKSAVPIVSSAGGSLGRLDPHFAMPLAPGLQGGLSTPQLPASPLAMPGAVAAANSVPASVSASVQTNAPVASPARTAPGAVSAGITDQRASGGGGPEAAVAGRVGRELIERSKAQPKSSGGLYQILVSGAEGGGRAAAESPAAAHLRMPAGLSADSQQAWARKSFDVMRGEDGGGSAVPAGDFKSAGNNGLSPAAPQARKSRKGAAVALGGAALLGGAAFLPLGEAGSSLAGVGDWFSNLFSWDTLSSPWYWAASIGVGVGFQVFKYWRKRQAKKKAEAGQNPVSLEPAALAERLEILAKKRGAKVSVHDFSTGRFVDLEVNAEMVEGARNGAYFASTDDTGVLFLSPNINGSREFTRPLRNPFDVGVDAALEEAAAERAAKAAGKGAASSAEVPEKSESAAVAAEAKPALSKKERRKLRKERRKLRAAAEKSAPESAGVEKTEAVGDGGPAGLDAASAGKTGPEAVGDGGPAGLDAASAGKTGPEAAGDGGPAGPDAERAVMVRALETAGLGAEVALYDAGISQFRAAKIAENLIQAVRSGQLDAFQSETGGLALAPSPVNAADEAAKAERASMVEVLKRNRAERPDLEVSVYDFELETYRSAALSDAMVADVADGVLDAFTDEAQQSIFLIPGAVVAVKRAAAEAKSEAAGEESAQGAHTASPSFAIPQPQSVRGVYGAVLGAVAGYALFAFLGAPALILPFLGWALFESYKDSSPALMKPEPYKSFWGAALGTLGAAVATAYGLPLAPALALPALGAALAYAVNDFIARRTAGRAVSGPAVSVEDEKTAEDEAPAEEAVAEVKEISAGDEIAGRAAGQTEDELPSRPLDESAAPEPEGMTAESLSSVRDEFSGTAGAESVAEAPAAAVVEKTEIQADGESAGIRQPEPDVVDAPQSIVSAAASAPKKAKIPKSSGAQPTGFRAFSKEAKEMTAAGLEAQRARALKRVQKLAPDARLIGVSINIGPKAHWIFTYHSPQTGKVYTVWQKRIGVKEDKDSQAGEKPAIWSVPLPDMISMSQAYARLKRAKRGFGPKYLEIQEAEGLPVIVFFDAKGRQQSVPAAALP